MSCQNPRKSQLELEKKNTNINTKIEADHGI